MAEQLPDHTERHGLPGKTIEDGQTLDEQTAAAYRRAQGDRMGVIELPSGGCDCPTCGLHYTMARAFCAVNHDKIACIPRMVKYVPESQLRGAVPTIGFVGDNSSGGILINGQDVGLNGIDTRKAFEIIEKLRAAFGGQSEAPPASDEQLAACPDCEGTGHGEAFGDGSGYIPCGTCDGTGKIDAEDARRYRENRARASRDSQQTEETR